MTRAWAKALMGGWVVCLAILHFSLSFSAVAQSLTLSPNRIVLEGRENKGRVLVSNPSDEEKSYRLQLLNRRMLEDGTYQNVEKGQEIEGENYADEIIRVSPRSFTLGPRSSQTVRVFARMTKDLPDGEYRSHLRVQVLPDAGPPVINEDQDKVNIRIRVNYGITIPIIVRKGELTYDVKIDSIELQQHAETGQPVLVTRLSREGLRSSYGDISVTFKDSTGKEHLVKFLPGLSLFYPNPARVFTIPLDVPQDLTLKNGTITVTYRTQEEEGGTVMAQSSKPL